MNYTTNYHLPQWVESDRILMEDFNQMCEDIETGLNSNAQAAAAAQATANATANAAYSPSNKPYVVGQYSGLGSGSQTITVGFRPSFLIVSSAVNNGGFSYSIITNGSQMTNRLAFTDTGFTVYSPNESYEAPNLNAIRSYTYIAFR